MHACQRRDIDLLCSTPRQNAVCCVGMMTGRFHTVNACCFHFQVLHEASALRCVFGRQLLPMSRGWNLSHADLASLYLIDTSDKGGAGIIQMILENFDTQGAFEEHVSMHSCNIVDTWTVLGVSKIPAYFKLGQKPRASQVATAEYDIDTAKLTQIGEQFPEPTFYSYQTWGGDLDDTCTILLYSLAHLVDAYSDADKSNTESVVYHIIYNHTSSSGEISDLLKAAETVTRWAAWYMVQGLSLSGGDDTCSAQAEVYFNKAAACVTASLATWIAVRSMLSILGIYSASACKALFRFERKVGRGIQQRCNQSPNTHTHQL